MKNNKLSLVLMIFFLASQMTMAQKFEAPVYQKGDMTFDFGFGLLPTANSPNIKSKIPPLSFGVNYRVLKNVSLGAFAAFTSTSFRSDLPKHGVIPRSIDSQQFMAGVRGSVHYDVNKTSFYGGLMLGYKKERMVTDIPQSKTDELPEFPVQTDNKMIYTAFLGARHMLTNHLGLFGEVGYGISIINVGASLKF